MWAEVGEFGRFLWLLLKRWLLYEEPAVCREPETSWLDFKWLAWRQSKLAPEPWRAAGGSASPKLGAAREFFEDPPLRGTEGSVLRGGEGSFWRVFVERGQWLGSNISEAWRRTTPGKSVFFCFTYSWYFKWGRRQPALMLDQQKTSADCQLTPHRLLCENYCLVPNAPVRDPLRPYHLFPSELLNFAVGQVAGDDVGGLWARVIDVELTAVHHHQPAELICARVWMER